MTLTKVQKKMEMEIPKTLAKAAIEIDALIKTNTYWSPAIKLLAHNKSIITVIIDLQTYTRANEAKDRWFVDKPLTDEIVITDPDHVLFLQKALQVYLENSLDPKTKHQVNYTIKHVSIIQGIDT